MKKVICIIWSLVLAITGTVRGADNVFKVINPDYKLSPYTGMTRQHWIEADKYLLEGAFRHIHSLDDPMYFERLGDVCYPKDSSRVRGATLEGMCRTLFLASPLLREDSTLTIHGAAWPLPGFGRVRGAGHIALHLWRCALGTASEVHPRFALFHDRKLCRRTYNSAELAFLQRIPHVVLQVERI